MVNTIILAGFIGLISWILSGAKKNYFSVLEQIDSDLNLALKVLSDYSVDDFSARFTEINLKMQEFGTIKDVWNDYRKTLTRTIDIEGQHKLYSSISASEVFNFNSLTYNIGHSYWKNLSGVFTGIGILGTFLGLTIGLVGVQMGSTDTAVLKDSIGQLLQGISVAFATSLVGIFVALLYGRYQHKREHSLICLVDEMVKRLDDMYPRLTIEQWLADGYRENIEQTKALKNLSQDVAEQLGQLLDEQLSSNFDNLCQNLNEQLAPVFENLLTAINKLNDSGASAITEAMSQSAGNQLNSFAEMLKDMRDAMQASMESSEKATNQANLILVNTLQRFEEAMANGAKKAAEGSEKAVVEIAETARDVAEKLHEILGESEKSLAENLSKIQEILTIGAQRAAEDNAKAIDNISETAKAAAEALQKTFGEQTDGISAAVEDMESRLKDVSEQLNDLLGKSGESLTSNLRETQKMAESVRKLLDELRASGGVLRDAVNPLQKASDNLSAELNKMVSENEKIRKSINDQLAQLVEGEKKMEENINRLSVTINEANDNLTESWQNLDSNFADIGDEIGEATDTLASRLADYNAVMNKAMVDQLKQFDKSFSAATGQLSTIVEELSEAVEDLKQNS